MKIIRNIFIFFTIFFLCFFIVKNTFADSVIDNGLNFLRSKQDATGRINTGFSAPSQWSSIAFTANGIDVAMVKNPDISLKDFLESNAPSEPSAATDWETRILSIVALGGDPTNYGGINYVTKLESFYINNQIGDTCSLNDDIFGLLAEVSSGSSSATLVKESVLNYLISKQDPADGGFGFSTPGCDWYSTSADMTAAGIQALVAAKQNGLTNPDLDTAIDKAKNYLLINQNSDGGYGYFGSSDSDTSGWVLMAFNVLDMKDSTEAANLKTWLLSQQSPTDGGFMAFDYGTSTFVSNSSTTAQAIIGLLGKNWILRIFDPTIITSTSGSGNPTPTITSSPTNTPTPFASPKPTAQAGTSTPTQTPTHTPSIGSENPTPTIFETEENITDQGEILGETSEIEPIKSTKKNFALPIIFFVTGIIFLIIHFVKLRKQK